MLNESLEFAKQNGLTFWTLWNFVGVSMGIVLGILKIYEFNKNRVSIYIKLKQDRFSSYRVEYPGTYEDKTIIEINVDLTNSGLEPTTLAGVDFYSDNELLNNLEMTTTTKYVEPLLIRKFEEIRIDGHGRPNFKLYADKNVLLPNDVREEDKTYKERLLNSTSTYKIYKILTNIYITSTLCVIQVGEKINGYVIKSNDFDYYSYTNQ